MWWTRRALGLHATVLVVVPGFLALGYWQLRRALSGNELSWAYTVEWPIFTAYALFMWWRLVHDIAGVGRKWYPMGDRTGERKERRETLARNEAEELEAYNAYLSELQGNEKPLPK